MDSLYDFYDTYAWRWRFMVAIFLVPHLIWDIGLVYKVGSSLDTLWECYNSLCSYFIMIALL